MRALLWGRERSLLAGQPGFDIYMAGMLIEQADRWLSKAREEKSSGAAPELIREQVRIARDRHREAISLLRGARQ